MEKTKAAKELATAKYIWIYGAGEVGRKAAADLRKRPIYSRLKGFVVSKCPDTSFFEGFEIVGLDSVNTPPEETFFLIAVSDKFQQEIMSMLTEHGYNGYAAWNPSFMLYSSDYTFINRKKGNNKLCLVLSGYKDFLWNIVFSRLEKFIPSDVEVCILSSGLYSEVLDSIAKSKDYSYLYTELNDLTLVQNLALCLYDDIEWVYKMDEDMFLTDYCFEKLMNTYGIVEGKERYKVGFVAPLIPLNGYSYVHILNHYGVLNEYENRFGTAYYGGHKERAIECRADVSGFIWGEDGGLPQLDDMNKDFSKKWSYSVCGVRYSIGFILFKREFWELLGGFNMYGETDLGVDELQICANCA
ncbi:MAG: hypothetical protein K6E34_14105, partial [Lachnospiraceae bacterium]|nr:hypothetical protein [Lachnospiraceae bacterium]